MSLVEPGRHWWQRERVLQIAAIVAWIVAFLAAVVAGWSNSLHLTGGSWEPWAGLEWLVDVEDVPRVAEISAGAFILPVILASAIDFYYRLRSDRGPAWFVAHAFGTTALGFGTGGLVATTMAPVPPLPAVLLTVLGALILAIHPVARWRVKVYNERQGWSRMHGTPADAEATKVDVVRIADVNRWSVTLKYEDTNGRTRWHRATIPTHTRTVPKAGDRYTLRYDPSHPGRRSAIHVNLTQPKNRRR